VTISNASSTLPSADPPFPVQQELRLSHFAALVARHNGRWNGSDVDLDDIEDIEDVTELIRDAVADETDPALLFVEENDEWFSIVRLDPLGDARVFISDVRAVVTSELAAVVFQDQLPTTTLEEADAALDDDDADADADADDAEPALRPSGEPGGSSDILTDLGVGSAQLLELCAAEGMLPADVISAICEVLGCAEAIEVYR
jgi:putative tRNA adenosine deaminase-associated protein